METEKNRSTEEETWDAECEGKGQNGHGAELAKLTL